MTLERANHIPDWAQRERWMDLAWIGDHLPAFLSAAQIAYEQVGRGAIVIDTAFQTQAGSHRAAYFTQQEILRYEDADIDRLVDEYEPQEELVVVLLKESGRSSSYRLRSVQASESAASIPH